MTQHPSNDLFGLVLVGGKSSRMNADKFQLNYHGKLQSEYCFEVLSDFCPQVFISAREDQKRLDGIKGYPLILDVKPFKDIGPLGGILSAMTLHPEVSWIVLACDLPFVNRAVLENLIDHRNPAKLATAFRSVHDGLPEPLCAIYEYWGLGQLRDFFDREVHCPRKILSSSDIELITLPEGRSLDNVNTPDEFKESQDVIQKSVRRRGTSDVG